MESVSTDASSSNTRNYVFYPCPSLLWFKTSLSIVSRNILSRSFLPKTLPPYGYEISAKIELTISLSLVGVTVYIWKVWLAWYCSLTVWSVLGSNKLPPLCMSLANLIFFLKLHVGFSKFKPCTKIYFFTNIFKWK